MTHEATPFAGRLGRREDEALFRRQRGRRVETGARCNRSSDVASAPDFSQAIRMTAARCRLAKNRLYRGVFSIILLVFSRLNGRTGRSCVS
jgi:hypothetical protein